MISSVTGRQLESLPNMIQPPLLGVVNAASAVSARTLTCRAPAVPRSCSMLSVYMAVRVRPFPKLPPLEQNGCVARRGLIRAHHGRRAAWCLCLNAVIRLLGK